MAEVAGDATQYEGFLQRGMEEVQHKLTGSRSRASRHGVFGTFGRTHG